MAESAGEKTEKATAHKRKEERKHGHVMQSKDVVTTVFILIVFGLLRIWAKIILVQGEDILSYWIGICGGGMGGNGETIDGMQTYARIVLECGKTVVITVLPLLLVSILVTVIGTGAQTKFLFSKESLKFKLSKLNPINGFKRMFSLNSLFEIVKSIIKLILLVVVVYGEIVKRIHDFAKLFDMEILQGVVYMADAVFSIVMKLSLVFVAIAAVDYLYQYFKYEKDIKMTKQEVKEEFKMLEGDPKIKGRRRQKQYEMAMSRMMQAVPEADVIIRNPTHIAVAVKYDEFKNNAPVVVAKGADNMAMKIIKVAEENNVTMVENKPLARSLYDAVEIDREIPPEFYHAVAEVLAFVYGLQGKKPGEKKNYY
ncbi:MAG: flagellar biosynthesis protein FlhB [Oscillospiraceae bacterium]